MKPFIRRLLTVVGLLIAGVLWLIFVPVMHRPFVHKSGPVPTYAEAVAQIKASIAETPANIGAPGIPRLMEHGQQTEYVYVLLHGLSNCPQQFEPLGQELFKLGHNVYIPRMFGHGESDRMATEWGKLTAHEMLNWGNNAVDVARGLGRRVIVVGLSVNGTTTAWMAQNRSDLHKVVLLSPFLAPAGTPLWTVGPVRNILMRLPNMFMWWNPKLKEKNPGPPYAYPRFPTRVIGETMLLGETVMAESRREAPKSPSILVVTTAIDPAANNAVTARLVENWQSHRPVEVYQFPKEQAVPHDFIDPHQPDGKVSLVYPKLIELFGK